MPLILAAVAVSLGLAAALLFWPGRIVLAFAAVIPLAFGVLDLREVVHQWAESRPQLATIAAGVAVLHLGVVTLAVLSLRAKAPPPTESGPAL